MAVQHRVFHWMQACVVLQLCLSEALPAASETSRNYYDTLHVEPTATDSQIKKAFRKLAIKYHPDKNKSADAENTFREIAEAYKVLSNKEKRRLYDSVGHEAFLKDGAPFDPEDEHETSFPFSFADLFHDLDDSLFVEEPYFHWSFHQDGEDEDSPYEHYSFEEPGFSFYFGDGDDNEEDLHY
ncbi:dnaJ homolog subfamily B member 9-like [Siniperca chuatsi]|uniref:dnaJ homolog subfamily B member 9-like n=1 Tax=Siniperca chuatsi TaxID=119488 RepID=UPI001CE18834|nr:dnaJ homolog subfamily B member 9-like [Siniperca chuatsi]XP_044078119.1 dnaJ homolog subfamily B member 9-like [Siniperca chuatsi]XP_044078128.1 dnaJ homolog subfamily B member 9-like [Siniperca chuatsi]XP_044078137.1 dnaJ homolog subfamily B member 9-like [Siniperca chuatsi]XP_044078146.1 dnaJ homolog subfamily B member 9-like [Siniperca chuatsi]